MSKSKLVREPLDRPHLKSVVSGTSKTVQSHKAACCINRIMDSVNRTGVLPVNPRAREPQYGDVSGLNKPFDQLIGETASTFSALSADISVKRAKDREARAAARKAAYDADVEAAVQKRLAEKGSATT